MFIFIVFLYLPVTALIPGSQEPLPWSRLLIYPVQYQFGPGRLFVPFTFLAIVCQDTLYLTCITPASTLSNSQFLRKFIRGYIASMEMNEIHKIKGLIDRDPYIFKNCIVQHRFFIRAFCGSSTIRHLVGAVFIIAAFCTSVVLFPLLSRQYSVTGFLVGILCSKFFKVHLFGQQPIIS